MTTRKPARFELAPREGSAEAVTRHQFNLAGRRIEYTLKRSRRRRGITFVVDGEGLRVGAPLRASRHRIETLLGAHSRWIDRKLSEWEARRPPAIVWQAGAKVMALGEPLTLALEPARAATERDGSRLCIAAADISSSDTLAAHTIAWLRATARNWFEQRAAHYAAALGVPQPSIHLSDARTRWGSCHPAGRVRLNWRLIQMPPEWIDYVVVHELAHLSEANHSPEFWRRVASVLPDYKRLRRALRREGHRYLIA